MSAKPKARVMWANYKTRTASARVFHSASDCHGDNEWTEHAFVAIPVAVIPLDDVDALVERAALAATNAARKLIGNPPLVRISDSEHPKNNLDLTRAALTAAGIPCKRRARK